jgi:hypothetical protein
MGLAALMADRAGTRLYDHRGISFQLYSKEENYFTALQVLEASTTGGPTPRFFLHGFLDARPFSVRHREFAARFSQRLVEKISVRHFMPARCRHVLLFLFL